MSPFWSRNERTIFRYPNIFSSCKGNSPLLETSTDEMSIDACRFEAVEPPAVDNMPRWARILLGRARRRTPDRPLTDADLVMIWERSEGRCAVSGLEFSSTAVGAGRARHPFMPSLDQIEPSKGYTANNVRLVCVAANFAMNAWGLDTLISVAKGVIKRPPAKMLIRGTANGMPGRTIGSTKPNRLLHRGSKERASPLLSGHERLALRASGEQQKAPSPLDSATFSS
jgi:hypothetical protein